MHKKLVLAIVVVVLAALSAATVSAQVRLNDPTVGDAEDGVAEAPSNFRFILSPACDLLDAPAGNVVIQGSDNGGGRYPVNAFTTTTVTAEDDDTIETTSLSFIRLTIGSESAWVNASCGQFIPAG